MEIVVGTYENFLVGYVLEQNSVSKKLELKQSFTDDAHCGSVRAISSSKKYIASGSVDETIHLVNMKHRIDAGAFNLHNGTITALEFYGTKHLFSGAEDGNIGIFSISNRKCEKILRGHKEPVTDIALHSTGKLLLSVSKDRTLRTWNLVKGRCAYILNLKEVSYRVHWAPNQANFAVVFDNHVDFYDVTNGTIVNTLGKDLFEKRIENMIYLDDENVLVYGDSDKFVIVNIATMKVVAQVEAHENRIKGMRLLAAEVIPDEFVNNNFTHWLVSTSNDGFIKLWSLNLNAKSIKAPIQIAAINTTCRPTCVAVWTEKQPESSNFVLPALNISEEELEQCKAKIREKRAAKVVAVTTPTEPSTDIRPKKKLKKSSSPKQKQAPPPPPQEEEPKPKLPRGGEGDDDDDDEEDEKTFYERAKLQALKQGQLPVRKPGAPTNPMGHRKKRPSRDRDDGEDRRDRSSGRGGRGGGRGGRDGGRDGGRGGGRGGRDGGRGGGRGGRDGGRGGRSSQPQSTRKPQGGNSRLGNRKQTFKAKNSR